MLESVIPDLIAEQIEEAYEEEAEWQEEILFIAQEILNSMVNNQSIDCTVSEIEYLEEQEVEKEKIKEQITSSIYEEVYRSFVKQTI